MFCELLHAACVSHIGSGAPRCPSPCPCLLASLPWRAFARGRGPAGSTPVWTNLHSGLPAPGSEIFGPAVRGAGLGGPEGCRAVCGAHLGAEASQNHGDGQRRAARVELCALRRALAKKVGAERVVLAPPLPNAAPPRPARVQKRTLELERKLAQQAWELDRLRALTSRAGVVNAMVAMLLTEAKAANIWPE